MSKRKETLLIENILIQDTLEKRIYGCEEITIGFYNNGHGNEIVDFMTMDSKGIIKCYEIKVTLSDLNSKAKKSFYGHYNYLVLTEELYEKIKNNITNYISSEIGILILKNEYKLQSKRKAIKQKISLEQELMLKESMVRSIYFKMIKYKDANNLEKQKELKNKISKLEKEKKEIISRAIHYEQIISDYETYKCYNENLDDLNLEILAKEEKEKYFKNKKLNS